MKKTIKIGNASAFWGDDIDASSRLLGQQQDLDYLTLDYLSEVSLSIMAVQRATDPATGYARDFVQVVRSLAHFWKRGSKVKVITNAGGLDPKQCAEACHAALKECGIHSLCIAVVYGDDIVDMIKSDPSNPLFKNFETKESISAILDNLTTGNAYLGAGRIAEALTLGADIVITGRVADPSLTVAPCVAHFGWSWNDYHKLAQATIAGHLIECGTQATGGISTDWLDVSDLESIGFPFVEIDENAHFIVTKPEKAGGIVTLDIIKEQLLYEIGDPAAYLSPDVTVSILSLKLEQAGKNRISVVGALGNAPPSTYKVSATYREGYRAEGMLAIFGRNCEAKARRCGEIILSRMKQKGYIPQNFKVECLGCGDVVPGVVLFQGCVESKREPLECVLRICAADLRKEVLEYFVRQIAPLVTSGPQGTTGYTTGRAHIRPVFGYWPCLIETSKVTSKVELLKVFK